MEHCRSLQISQVTSAQIGYAKIQVYGLCACIASAFHSCHIQTMVSHCTSSPPGPSSSPRPHRMLWSCSLWRTVCQTSQCWFRNNCVLSEVEPVSLYFTISGALFSRIVNVWSHLFDDTFAIHALFDTFAVFDHYLAQQIACHRIYHVFQQPTQTQHVDILLHDTQYNPALRTRSPSIALPQRYVHPIHIHST